MHGMMIWKGKLEHRQLAIIFGDLMQQKTVTPWPAVLGVANPYENPVNRDEGLLTELTRLQ